MHISTYGIIFTTFIIHMLVTAEALHQFAVAMTKYYKNDIWIKQPCYWINYCFYLLFWYHEVHDLYVIGIELFILLANTRLLWVQWNNFLVKQVDVGWTVRINIYVRDVFIGRNEKLIRIDFKLSNFFMDGCHWIMNKGIREAFSDGCVHWFGLYFFVLNWHNTW